MLVAKVEFHTLKKFAGIKNIRDMRGAGEVMGTQRVQGVKQGY